MVVVMDDGFVMVRSSSSERVSSSEPRMRTLLISTSERSTTVSAYSINMTNETGSNRRITTTDRIFFQ